MYLIFVSMVLRAESTFTSFVGTACSARLKIGLIKKTGNRKREKIIILLTWRFEWSLFVHGYSNCKHDEYE